MRSKFISIALIVIAFSAKAQTWAPVSTGIDGAAANTTWALYSYDSIMYAGGWFSTAGGVGVNDMAQWNGINWAPMGTGSSGYINAMVYYNGNLYAGGEFDTIGGVIAHDIAMWNGTNWMPVGTTGMRSAQYGVYAMAVYKGELYAGGSFDTVDGKQVFGIAKWNGTAWSALGSGVYAADEDDGVFAMTVYNGNLYVAGGLDSAGGVPITDEVAKWDGSTWSNLGGFTNGPMYALAVYNGNLYMGGWADTIGGLPANSIARWNDTTWTSLGMGLYGEPGGSQVSALVAYNGELYAGGYFDSVNGGFLNGIAKWNGSQWSKVGGSIGVNISGSIDAMTIFNNSLYAGGGFDSIGGVYAKNIAMWTSPNSVTEISDDNAVSVYPIPSNRSITVHVSIYDADMQYVVYNELGQQVENGVMPPSKNIILDISSYPSGLYLLSIRNSAKTYSTRFIKNQ
jgi:hypothetical protein